MTTSARHHEQGRHKLPPSRTKRRSAPIRVAGTSILVLILIGVTVLLLMRLNGQTTTRVGSPATQSGSPIAITSAPLDQDQIDLAQAISWISANLSLSAVIVSDSATVAQLRQAGFSAATSYTDSAHQALQTFDYMLWIAKTPSTQSVTGLLATSLPLAIFGASSAGPALRQVLAQGVAVTRAQQTQDSALRRSGGAELVKNPRIVFDASSRSVLESGRLDLRAENVSNVLATSGPIWVAIDSEDPAEARAGQPARSITVTAQNPQAMQVTMAALTPPYRPATINPIGPGKFRLVWSPQLASVAIAGG